MLGVVDSLAGVGGGGGGGGGGGVGGGGGWGGGGGGGGGGSLLGGRCLLECGHREIRYTSVNPNFFLDD